jgi:hypothetical protein
MTLKEAIKIFRENGPCSPNKKSAEAMATRIIMTHAKTREMYELEFGWRRRRLETGRVFFDLTLDKFILRMKQEGML